MNYPEPVRHLFNAFERAGRDLFLVGGAVRDFELGRPFDTLDDLDFCTDARPPETARILREAGITVYELGTEFGTVGAVLYAPDDDKNPLKTPKYPEIGENSAKNVEKRPESSPVTARYPKDCQITTYRSEEYYRRGSRHPVVKFGDTIAQDLGRRDFSINSMALDARGALVDPYGGRHDLQNGILRVVGDPLETLAEDPLRILRVGRFISKLGFEPTDSLRQAADQRADGILDISAERWLQEMGKLLRGRHVGRALTFLHDIRILGMILPEVDALWTFHPAHTPLQAAPKADPKSAPHGARHHEDRTEYGARHHESTAEHDAWHHDQNHAQNVENTNQIATLCEPMTNESGPFWNASVRALERAPRVDEAADTRLGWALLLQHIGRRWTVKRQDTGELIYPGHRKLASHTAREIAQRFRFDNDSTHEVTFLLAEHGEELNYGARTWSDAMVRRWVRRMKGHERAMLNFQRANISAGFLADTPQKTNSKESDIQELLAALDGLAARVESLRAQGRLHPVLPSGLGNSLMRELGLKPSPIIGELKNWLDEEIIDERIESGRDSYYYVEYVRRAAPTFLNDYLRADQSKSDDFID